MLISMNSKDWTDSEADQMFHNLLAGDVDLPEIFAKAAIRSAADIHSDMMSGDSSLQMFDENDARELAIEYVKALMVDFQKHLIERIEAVQFSLRTTTTVTTNISFDS